MARGAALARRPLLAAPGCVLFVFTLASLAWTETKTWRFDAEWSNAANWLLRRPPECGDAVELGASQQAMVALPAEACALTLRLAPNVELLLPRDGQLLLQGSSDSTSEVNTWARRVRAWMDPGAWAVERAEGGGRAAPAVEMPQEAVPHVERVPCRWDAVRLPAVAFSMLLPALRVRVAQLWLGARALSATLWRRLLEKPAATTMLNSQVEGFGGGGGVEAAGGACADAAGCACHGANSNAVQALVCAHVTCAAAVCARPVRPTGHCCSVCGAVLWLRVDGRFQLRRLRELLRERGGESPGLLLHASRLADGRVQVVVMERGMFQGASADAARRLQMALEAGSASLGVQRAWMEAAAPAAGGGAMVAALAVMLGTLLATSATFAAIFLFFSRRRGASFSSEERHSFSFARFENVDYDTDSVEVEVGSPINSENPPSTESQEASSKSDTPLGGCEQPGDSL